MNKVILIGNLTKDPEVRTTNNGTYVTTFSIAAVSYTHLTLPTILRV